MCSNRGYMDATRSWAVDESRRDGTAAVLCPKLEQAEAIYERLISAAKSVAQDAGERADFDSARVELGSLACELMDWMKQPRSSKTAPAQSDDEAEGTPAGSDVAHSIDFRSVRWFRTIYSFTTNQAPVVRLLYEHWQAGKPDVGDETLLFSVDPEVPPARLSTLFRDHPAWGTMIVGGGSKGTHRLSTPEA